MNFTQTRFTRRALSVAIASLAATGSALADGEVDALKRELAEQKQLIQQLIAKQDSQKQAIDKIESRPTASPSASASSSGKSDQNITLYGTLDVNVANTNSGYGRKTSIGAGGMTASSVGVKGQRDIGGGTRVIGDVEIGFDLSSGTVGNGASANGVNVTAPSSGGLTGTGNQIFSRQAYAGIANDQFGQLTLGRQYTGSYIAAAIQASAMGPGFFGSGATFLPIIGGMPTRVNNAIVYRTPSLQGLSGYLTYTVGSENNLSANSAISGTSTSNDRAGAGWDAALFYKNGNLNAALTGWNINHTAYATAGETGLAKKTGWQAVANYNLGFMKLYGTYLAGKISGGNYENVTQTLSKASGWSTSAAVPFGKHSVLMSYSKLDDESKRDRDGSLVGLAYTYKLYENTALYGSWGRQTNNSRATYSLANGGDLVGNVPAGSGFSPTGVMVGLNTKF